LLGTLLALHRKTGARIAVVGHSRGGVLAKVLSHRKPDLVEQVITLGSPLNDPFDVHPLTMAGVHAAHLFNAVRYRHPASVEMRFLRYLKAAPRVPTTSTYPRSDGVVNWKACLRPDINAIEGHGRPRELAFLWAGAFVNYASLFTASLLTTYYGLGVWDGLVATALGTVAAAVILGLLSNTGPRSGLPQIAFTRSIFGLRGSYVG